VRSSSRNSGSVKFDCSARYARCLLWLAPLAARFAGKPAFSSDRTEQCVEESALLLTPFVGSSYSQLAAGAGARCARSVFWRSAARTSRARIAPGSRLFRRHSGTKSASPRFSSARRRAIGANPSHWPANASRSRPNTPRLCLCTVTSGRVSSRSSAS